MPVSEFRERVIAALAALETWRIQVDEELRNNREETREIRKIAERATLRVLLLVAFLSGGLGIGSTALFQLIFSVGM